MKPKAQSTALLILIILYSIFFTYNHLATTEWGATSFRKLVDGTAITPMQYRALVPWLAWGLEHLTPALPFIHDLNGIRALLEFVSVLSLMVVFVWGTRRLLALCFPALEGAGRDSAEWFTLLLFMLALPFHFLTPRTQPTYYYPSDIPSILVFVIGIVSVLRRQYLAFYLAFILGTLNRETTCFLTVFLLLAAWQRGSRRSLLLHALAQAAIWIGIKAALYALYSNNTVPEYCDVCSIFKLSVRDNLEYTGSALWSLLPSVYGFLWIPLLIVARFIPHRGLRRGLWLVPIFHVVMFIPGEIYELRIYVEMLPLVVWGAAFGMLALLLRGAATRIPDQVTAER